MRQFFEDRVRIVEFIEILYVENVVSDAELKGPWH